MDVRPYMIPDFKPTFGGFDYTEMVRPTLPAVWTSEVAGFGFVEPDNINATDANPWGSRSTPRLTLPATTPSSPLPADFVLILKGNMTRTGNGKNYLCFSGTDSNPVWVGGEDADNRATSSMDTFFVGNNIIFEHFEVKEADGALETRPSSLYPTVPCNRICFRNLYAKGSGEYVAGVHTGLSIQGDIASPTFGQTDHRYGFIIYNCDFSDLGSEQWTYDNGQDAGNADYHAFSVTQACSRVWVLNNKGNRSQGDGIQLGVAQLASNLYPEHLYIAGNEFHRNGENAIDFKKCRKVIYSTNDSTTRGVNVISHDVAEDIWIINNSIHDSLRGTYLSSCVRNYFIGNRTWNIAADENTPDQTDLIWGVISAMFVKEADDSYIINNTFSEYLRGFELHSGTNLKISNNILTNRVPRAGQVDPLGEDYIVEAAVRSNTQMLNNFSEDYRGRFASTSTISTDIGDLNGVAGTDPTNTNNANSSNMLLDMNSGVKFLSLGVGSDLIEAGTIDHYDTVNTLFFNMFGVNLDRDLFGYDREQGTLIDVGCNEYGTSLAPASPLRPTSLLADAVNERLVWSLSSVNEDEIIVNKNGVLFGTATAGSTELAVAGISGSSDVFTATASNTFGAAESLPITTDLLSITPIVGDLSLELDDAKSYVAVRPYINSKAGAITIDEPQYIGNKYGIDSTKVVFTKSAVEVGNGFNYVTNDSGSISGSVGGTGTCDVTLALNSYNGASTSRITVNSTYADFTCAEGDLAKYVASIGISADTPYAITPITTDTKHSTGLVSIVET